MEKPELLVTKDHKVSKDHKVNLDHVVLMVSRVPLVNLVLLDSPETLVNDCMLLY